MRNQKQKTKNTKKKKNKQTKIYHLSMFSYVVVQALKSFGKFKGNKNVLTNIYLWLCYVF